MKKQQASLPYASEKVMQCPHPSSLFMEIGIYRKIKYINNHPYMILIHQFLHLLIDLLYQLSFIHLPIYIY